MKRFMAGVVVGMVLAGGVAYAQPTTLTGQSYNGWPNDWRFLYDAGFVNGTAAGIGVGTTSAAASGRLIRCLETLTLGQWWAIVDQYVRDHPNEQTQHISALATRALFKTCAAR